MLPRGGAGRTNDERQLARALLLSARWRGRSHTARAEIEIGESGQSFLYTTILYWSRVHLGAFDDSGAMGTCVVHHQERDYLYYNGWNRGVTVPFVSFIGCAAREAGYESFERMSRAPVVGRTDADPFLAMSAWVRVEEGRWRMWYVSGVDWTDAEPQPRHRYRIVYAEAADRWRGGPTGHVCIDFASEDEYAIARPCVIRDEDCYRMWFSTRGSSSTDRVRRVPDGLTWQRDDDRGGLRPAGRRLGIAVGRIRLCVRLRREALDALQRQRLRRDWDRPGRDGGDRVNRAYAFVA